ncbi:C2H2-like zinc finger protein [Perilla frutescens var. hirtella]|uniref:C2H2-like zinc finger protein n=1 Tax=Perilla frutescens var. hirtella TaxID=608512 RepID=A0AAD4JGS0_PERFH|nr:C2H2-like zinc finger protein [Perilla frutescens var. hirtella]
MVQAQQKQKQKLKQPQTTTPITPQTSTTVRKQHAVNNKSDQTSEKETSKKCKKMKCSGSLCSNTKVMQKPESDANSSTRSLIKTAAAVTLSDLNNNGSSLSSSSSSFLTAAPPSASPSISSSLRSMPFRKLSGCYECRMVVDPVLGMTRDPSLRNTISSCHHCGEIFMKPENLELHQAVKHAVCELGAEDTSKNIVEIIFQSSWLKKQSPVCKIDRILKVQNTPKTISKFEEYRDTIKSKATALPKKHPRCLADGNELLRFHCTTFMCSLGLNSSSNLCNSIPTCIVCSIIKNGFKLVSSKGILTTATSGKAHDSCRAGAEEGKRAMLVCRVIAGRVKKNPDGNSEDYDSVAGAAGVYSNLDELYVFNPRAILPCFVVIYRGF